jgi:hypothetical protein
MLPTATRVRRKKEQARTGVLGESGRQRQTSSEGSSQRVDMNERERERCVVRRDERETLLAAGRFAFVGTDGK